ncbi:MAG TPA: hypothetical protein VIJ87_02030 [Pyrinomonadaceae bacterium]
MTSLNPGKRQITSGQLDHDTGDKVKVFIVFDFDFTDSQARIDRADRE